VITITIDVESIGIHGEAFAVGFIVHHNGVEIEAGCFACDPDAAKGTDADREWVANHIPPIMITDSTPREVRQRFWDIWMHWREKGALMVADCAWPVEARFLLACIDDDPEERCWKGPYPLHDLATRMLDLGHDPKQRFSRLENELPEHHPLADARQSARLWWERQGILKVLYEKGAFRG
jgi:hypothetical protein